jgi:hypothetical protein
MTEWDDTPLYLWDEWNAYINGGAVGVDQVQGGLWHDDWQDGVAGQLEFSVYALALAQAVSENDPEYFADYRQFTEFLAWNLKRSFAVYALGSVMPQFRWDTQDRYLDSLRRSNDASELRAFTQRIFGAKWTKDVLGF